VTIDGAAVTPSRPRRSRWRPSARRVWFVVSLLVCLVLWQVASDTEVINPTFIASPTEIVSTAVDEIQTGDFWHDVRVSATAFFLGFGAAAILGPLLGMIIGMNRRLRYAAEPWVDLFNAMPRVALLPLVVIWVGLGIKAAIVVAFMGAFISILISTIDGVRTIDPANRRVARSFGASRTREFVSVVFPGTIPSIMSGLRIGVERALIGVFVAELFGGNAGIGFMIKKAGETLQADKVFFGVIVFIVFGLVAIAVLDRLQRRFEHWRPRRIG
jgi:ABC-type nitrate/sulfonate/bicarbonate transport system permease component